MIDYKNQIRFRRITYGKRSRIWIIKKISIDDSLYLFILCGLLGGYIKEIVILFIIVIMHEIGHVIFFRLFNIEIDKIVIYPSGGMCYVNKKINIRLG